MTVRTSRNNSRDNGHPGVLVPTGNGWAFSSFTCVANQARIVRFVLDRPVSLVNIAFGVAVAAGADDACDVGIYSAALSKIASSGATTGKLNSTGTKTIALAVELAADTVYYAAFSCGTLGGTAAQVASATWVQSVYARLFGTAAPELETDLMAAAHPLPSTFTPAGTGGSGVVFALREF